VKQELHGFDNISVRRIQELLQKNLKLPAMSAAKKPLLTAKMTKKRLAFCRKYLKWTPKQWENVIFSGESTFRLVNSRGSIVRRPRGISATSSDTPSPRSSTAPVSWCGGVLVVRREGEAFTFFPRTAR
jgi:hypothetical protein